MITHRELIDISNYGGAIPLRVPIEELLRGKVINYVQRLVGDNPNATVYIGKIELLDENTNQILLGIGFGDPRNSKLPLVGRGLYHCSGTQALYRRDVRKSLSFYRYAEVYYY